LESKDCENQRHFHLWKQNLQCYGQTEATIAFSASNTFGRTLGMDSNCSWGMPEESWKLSTIRDILACTQGTSKAIDKQMPRLDSAHRIGPNTLLVQILIVVGGCQKLEFKNRENQRHFGLQNENERCYGEMDATVGFSASNRSKYPLGTDSNCSWRMS